MIAIRKSDERGRFDHGWLVTQHTFSFGEYHDSRHHRFRALRVINEDLVQPGEGFDTHPHRDMEIITYVVSGALEHRDNMGNGTVIRPGDVQRMTAGTGIEHSEFNPSNDEPTHLLQIWIFPEEKGLEPSYEQKHFGDGDKRGRLKLVASRDGREGSVTIRQDAAMYAALLGPGDEATHRLAEGRHAWVQLIRGRVRLDDATLEAGDGAAISESSEIDLRADEPSELLLFDLA